MVRQPRREGRVSPLLTRPRVHCKQLTYLLGARVLLGKVSETTKQDEALRGGPSLGSTPGAWWSEAGFGRGTFGGQRMEGIFGGQAGRGDSRVGRVPHSRSGPSRSLSPLGAPPRAHASRPDPRDPVSFPSGPLAPQPRVPGAAPARVSGAGRAEGGREGRKG